MTKVAVLEQLGAGSVRVQERAPEPLGAGQARVRFEALSLNYRDLLVAKGLYGPGAHPPLIPGSDGAGEVVEVAEDVARLAVGDSVCTHMLPAWTRGKLPPQARASALGGPADGVFAEERVLDAAALVRIPADMPKAYAACLPVAGLTAWSALHSMPLGPGKNRVLVLGTGGVSTFGLQLGKALGLAVAITSAAPQKLERVRQLGADLALCRLSADWPAEVRRWSGGGVDVVLEVGGDGTFDQSLRAVRDEGCIALIGVLAQRRQGVRLEEVLMRQIRVQGILCGHRDRLEELVSFVHSKGIAPEVGRRYSGLGSIKRAYAAMELARHVGKCVVEL